MAASPTAPDASADRFQREVFPLITLVVGIATVLGLIIVLRVNAFIALISAAMLVSLLAPGDVSDKIGRVATAFGSTAGGIGIVIALAAVIGKCMLDSGAADRIVRAFTRVLGEKQAPLALMGSGYFLAIPVFFDTVFYLLVPLARSLHKRTGRQYLKYILAIAAGGAITHSLVPPTPGPLLMASTLNVDLGLMIMVGAIVALPASLGGVIYAHVAERLMRTPMRSLGSEPEPEPLADEKLPPLAVAVLPVLLPVLLISTNTILTTLADLQPTTRIAVESVPDWDAFQQRLRQAAMGQQPAGVQRLWNVLPDSTRDLLATAGTLTAADRQQVADDLNQILLRKDFYDEAAFAGAPLSDTTKGLLNQNRSRMRQAVLQRMNRLLLEESLNAGETTLLTPHQWLTPRRWWAETSDLFGNANLALLLSTVIALVMLARQRGLTRNEVAHVVETSLMSGGVIILITSGGGAFGAMLQAARIGDAIQSVFGGLAGSGGGSGLAFLLLGFLLASVLKVAQGSGTVSMIVGSSMMAAIVGPDQLGFHPVYLAMAIGAGSMVGSWMNDSGFWIFAKMGGLTETEALKSWTLLLVFLGIVAFATTVVMALLLPLNPAVG
ncbi:MAG: gluconate permease [Pirellulaceae bacterium]|nr:gluconate permease [Pirellulaceae bacterium]